MKEALEENDAINEDGLHSLIKKTHLQESWTVHSTWLGITHLPVSWTVHFTWLGNTHLPGSWTVRLKWLGYTHLPGSWTVHSPWLGMLLNLTVFKCPLMSQSGPGRNLGESIRKPLQEINRMSPAPGKQERKHCLFCVFRCKFCRLFFPHAEDLRYYHYISQMIAFLQLPFYEFCLV